MWFWTVQHQLCGSGKRIIKIELASQIKKHETTKPILAARAARLLEHSSWAISISSNLKNWLCQLALAWWKCLAHSTTLI